MQSGFRKYIIGLSVAAVLLALTSYRVFSQSPGWTVDPSAYEYSGEVNAVLYLGPDLTTTGTLGIFSGSVCRGFVSGVVFPPTGQTVFSLMCYSNQSAGEILTFRYFNPLNSRTYAVTESVTFTSDMILGTAPAPNVLHAPLVLTLNITGLLLEGLYAGSGMMREASNDFGPQWGAGIADRITVELHSSSSYSTVIYRATNTVLMTNGTATISLPLDYNGSYYITIKHRNSIETTTANPVSFSPTVINQSFGSRAQVFGSNLALSADGRFLVYGGDIDQDGFVGVSDMAMVDNQSAAFASGYLVEDADGDGFIGVSDMAIIDNNSASFVSVITP